MTTHTPASEEIERLLRIAALAKQAQWLHGACWDLVDGSGCFIPTESMKRFDEVFNELGRALADIVALDDEEQDTLFHRPFARAEQAEAERDALRAELAALRAPSAPRSTTTLSMPLEPMHLAAPLAGGEYTLCGVAYDAHASGDVASPILIDQPGDPITCPECLAIIQAAKAVRRNRVPHVKASR